MGNWLTHSFIPPVKLIVLQNMRSIIFMFGHIRPPAEVLLNSAFRLALRPCGRSNLLACRAPHLCSLLHLLDDRSCRLFPLCRGHAFHLFLHLLNIIVYLLDFCAPCGLILSLSLLPCLSLTLSLGLFLSLLRKHLCLLSLLEYERTQPVEDNRVVNTQFITDPGYPAR